MLGFWAELLPLFIVRKLALRYCKRVRPGIILAAVARPGTLFAVLNEDSDK